MILSSRVFVYPGNQDLITGCCTAISHQVVMRKLIHIFCIDLKLKLWLNKYIETLHCLLKSAKILISFFKIQINNPGNDL